MNSDDGSQRAPETSPPVALVAAGAPEGELLGNLLELYIHDLSPLFPRVELGSNGRFGYPGLAPYLSGSDAHFAFIVRCDGRTAGFVLAHRGSPLVADPDVLDIAEFFVLRRFRASGVGRSAAHLLWDRVPGAWTVRAANRNRDAVSFWRAAVGSYTSGSAREYEHGAGSDLWTVFSFDSPAPPSVRAQSSP
ncbi:MAG TPA: GNAT family N-acetyltransferase [Polyangiaceae bacterium]